MLMLLDISYRLVAVVFWPKSKQKQSADLISTLHLHSLSECEWGWNNVVEGKSLGLQVYIVAIR